MAMASSGLLFFLAFNLAITFSNAQLLLYCPGERGNYTANSTYKANLDNLLSSFAANDYGFYSMSVGQNSDRVKGIALCRGDVNPDVCLSCINNATSEITNLCPKTVRYDYCMLRYSNRSVLGVMETNIFVRIRISASVADPVSYNQTLSNLLFQLIQSAAAGGSVRKFAKGDANANFQPIYALVQCTPDLSQKDCTTCLESSYQQIPQCCAGRRRGGILTISCTMQFGMESFYNATPSLSPPPSNETTNSTGNTSNTSLIVIAVVVPTASVLILAICVCLFLRSRKKKETLQAMDGKNLSPRSLQFDFDVIRDATNNFSDENKLGQGGFGAVYKGTLPSRQHIAVKRLSRESKQGETEFKNEVSLVAELQHRNLVRLLGFSLEGVERLLVYEFVPNGSLDRFIFDGEKRKILDGARRYNIIKGIVRGLLYIHEDSRLRIIHRDLKASNVLLDKKMDPKIADFGIARSFAVDETQGDTSKIVGTYGYMAPEYALHGKFSVKSDVYSFGVLVLETITGQKINCFQDGEDSENLLCYAWKKWEEGSMEDLIDPAIGNSSKAEMKRCIHVALLCVQANKDDRPSMASVGGMFDGNPTELPDPSQPPVFFVRSTSAADLSSIPEYPEDETLPLPKNEASSSEFYPR